jgi:hypothetical protein
MYLQLDHALLGPLISRDGIGAYGEATFLYKPTGTLLVTDVVIQVLRTSVLLSSYLVYFDV